MPRSRSHRPSTGAQLGPPKGPHSCLSPSPGSEELTGKGGAQVIYLTLKPLSAPLLCDTGQATYNISEPGWPSCNGMMMPDSWV